MNDAHPPTVPGTISRDVANLLRGSSSTLATRFANQYREPEDASFLGQLRAMNSYWRSQLSAAPADTLSVRENLIDDCSYIDWMRLFREHVIPAIVALNLPQTARQAATAFRNLPPVSEAWRGRSA